MNYFMADLGSSPVHARGPLFLYTLARLSEVPNQAAVGPSSADVAILWSACHYVNARKCYIAADVWKKRLLEPLLHCISMVNSTDSELDLQYYNRPCAAIGPAWVANVCTFDYTPHRQFSKEIVNVNRLQHCRRLIPAAAAHVLTYLC